MKRNGSTSTKIVLGIATTVVGGFLLALCVAECRSFRKVRDTVLRIEAEKAAKH